MIKKLLFLSLFLTSSYLLAQSSWELLNPKPTTNTGKKIEFITNDVGYIITSNELLETLDAGNTWSVKQDISRGNDMSFYGSTAYIVGDDGFVLKSTDSGASWNEISTGFYSSFNTVNIIDDNNIIICASYGIVKTVDGGNTWEMLYIPNGGANKISFTSSLIGHAACSDGTIIKTIDGGQNWYVTENLNTSYSSFDNIKFVNENIGFAIRGYNDIYKTTDAGETWIEVSNVNQSMYDLYFLDENNGFITGENGATFKTTDGGNTWDSISFQEEYTNNSSIYSIYFEDANTGYATGNDGLIIKTTDGGNTWMPNSLTYNDFRQLQFINESIGYAQSENNFYKTVDGGDSWSLISSLNIDSSISSSDFTFVDENIGYATTGGSNGGHVFKTIDGGATWSALNNGEYIINEGITSITFLNENEGFVSGGFNQKKVLKTTDGGSSWTEVLDQKFQHIQFIDDLVGYGNAIANYYSYSNAIYKTTDGGNTWKNLNIELEGDYISAFDFVDQNNGYIVGGQGLIYKTTDGGINWEELYMSYRSYTNVNFYSKNVGYISDQNGKLYKTINGGISWEYLTQHYTINSIEIVGDKIYTAGSNGKIYRSTIEYDNINITLDTNNSYYIDKEPVILKGSVISNMDEITDIKFLYGKNSSTLDNEIPASVTTVEALGAENVNAELSGLEARTYYYYQLVGTSNGVQYKSEVNTFYTPSEYEVYVNYVSVDDNTSVEVSAEINSFNKKITAIEFIYGTKSGSLVYSTPADTDFVNPGRNNVNATLSNLTPNTKYYVKVKAIHNGIEIYSYNIREFTTKPDYVFDIDAYTNNNSATLQARVYAYKEDLKNITFEYGSSSEMTNSVIASPSVITVNNEYSNDWVSSEINGLNRNQTYFYRLKALQGKEYVYSETKAFNFTGDFSVTEIQSVENEDNSVSLSAYIYPGYNTISNIKFEYGLSPEFGNSITTTPDYLYYNGGWVGITIPKSVLTENTTYYYRLRFNVYSEEYLSNNNTFITNERYSVDEDNYKIEFTNETCVNKNNGTIKITPIIVQNYEATINNKQYSFTNELFIEDIEPGKYLICVAIAGNEESQQCFEIQIEAAETVVGKINSSKTSSSRNNVSFYIAKGTSPFRVVSNGKTIGTYSNRSFEAMVKEEGMVEVYSSLPCEGKIEQYISPMSISIYPNPVVDQAKITLPTTKLKNSNINIKVVDNSGKVVINKSYPVVNNTVNIDMSTLNSGMYFIKVYTDKVETIKIMKK